MTEMIVTILKKGPRDVGPGLPTRDIVVEAETPGDALELARERVTLNIDEHAVAASRRD